MAGHNRDGPGADRGREGRQVPLAQLGQAALDGGDGRVRVGAGAAVAGEVLGARGHARALQAGHRGGGVSRHQVGVRAEGAGADRRAVRRAEHVGARRQVEVDPQGSQIKTDGPGDSPGKRHVVDRAERRVPRIRAAVGVRDPGDVPALLVDRDHRIGGGNRGSRTQGSGQRAHLLRRDDIRAEQRDARQPPRQRLQDPPRRRTPRERRDEDGVRQPGQARVRAGLQRRHPFTAPATRPARRRRWTSRKKAKTGTVNSVEAAMIAPQSAPFRP